MLAPGDGLFAGSASVKWKCLNNRRGISGSGLVDLFLPFFFVRAGHRRLLM